MRGLTLSPTALLVFELYVGKQAVAGMPVKEAIVAWAHASVVKHGQVGGWVGGRECVWGVGGGPGG